MLKTAAEEDAPLSMEAFGEDWNESQFWVRVALTKYPTLRALPLGWRMKKPGRNETEERQR